VCELVLDWLDEDESREWLMILDNADNSELFFQPVDSEEPDRVNTTLTTKKPLIDYLPRKLDSKRSLIVTTRNRGLGEDLSNREPCVEILPFSLQEATLLLRSRAGTVAASWNNSDSKKLFDVLGCIPLAITQAASFMRRNKMSLKEYLETLERDEQNLKDSLSVELQDHRRELLYSGRGSCRMTK
jgi:hypothetical protein